MTRSERADTYADRAEKIVLLGVYGFLIWQVLPVEFKARIVGVFAGGQRYLSAHQQAATDRNRLTSEAWHIRAVIDDYNADHDSARFERALCLGPASHPRRDQNMAPPPDGTGRVGDGRREFHSRPDRPDPYPQSEIDVPATPPPPERT